MTRKSINLEKIGTSVVKAIEEPQFWSSFVSTVGSAFFIGFSKMVLIKLWNRSVASVEHIAKVDEAYQRGLAFHSKAQYQDAVKEFRFAKDHFDQMLNVLLQSNTRLHQLYSNICYSYALALTATGEYTIALVILDACGLKQQQWHTSHADADIPNLYGAIYLKQKQYLQASAAFLESLGIDYNQEDIQLLQAYASLKIPQDEKVSPDEKISLIELSKQEQRSIIVSTKLYNSQHATIIAFEVNLAHLQMLLEAERYPECLEKLDQLESSYTAIPLAAADRSRLYELFINVLKHIPEDIIKEEKHEMPSPFPIGLMSRSPTRKPLNKEEKEKLITEYELKLKKSMPKVIEVVMRLVTPTSGQIKQANTLLIYPVGAYWLFKQQSKNHRITNKELLQTLKITSLRELHSNNEEYCLSYHQKWMLLKYFKTLHSDKLNKRSMGALLSYGIVAGLGVKVVTSVWLQNTNSDALRPK